MSYPECEICGSPVVPTKHFGKRFCSRRCGGVAGGRTNAGKKKIDMPKYTCAQCGVAFECYHKVRKFCSRKCTGLWRRWNVPVIRNPFRGERPYNGRKDSNHDVVVNALVAFGCSIIDLSKHCGGLPDILAGYDGLWYAIEIKNPKTQYGRNGFNRAQLTWVRRQKAPVYIVRNEKEAVAVVTQFAKG